MNVYIIRVANLAFAVDEKLVGSVDELSDGKELDRSVLERMRAEYGVDFFVLPADRKRNYVVTFLLRAGERRLIVEEAKRLTEVDASGLRPYGEQEIFLGRVGDTLYILLEGSVRIQKTTLQNQPYTVVILKEHENVYFGEVALIDSDKCSATVVAETPCSLFSITRESFLQFCEENPYIGYKITMQIARKLSASLRKMNRDVITLFEALVTEVEGENIVYSGTNSTEKPGNSFSISSRSCRSIVPSIAMEIPAQVRQPGRCRPKSVNT